MSDCRFVENCTQVDSRDIANEWNISNTVILEDGEMNEIDHWWAGGVQMILTDDQTTEEPFKGSCASEPEGPSLLLRKLSYEHNS